MQQLAFDHLLREFDQYVEDAEIALLHGDFEGLHVEPVAGEDAFRVAPLRVGGGASAAGLGLVDDVVVNECRGVNDFDDGGEFDRARTFVAEQFGRKQQKSGTDALAAAGAQVFTDFGDGGHVRDGILPELLLDGDNVVPEQVEDLFPVNGAGCAQVVNSHR